MSQTSIASFQLSVGICFCCSQINKHVEITSRYYSLKLGGGAIFTKQIIRKILKYKREKSINHYPHSTTDALIY